jgi:hypothetical protein
MRPLSCRVQQSDAASQRFFAKLKAYLSKFRPADSSRTECALAGNRLRQMQEVEDMFSVEFVTVEEALLEAPAGIE